jgi:hypothetical protein
MEICRKINQTYLLKAVINQEACLDKPIKYYIRTNDVLQ